METRKKMFFVLIMLAVCIFASTYLFKGCGHKTEQSLKQLLSKRKNAVINVKEIKKKLFRKYDSIELFTIEYTGRTFNLSRRKNGEMYDQTVFISYYLTEEDQQFFRSFMNKEDIYYLYLYKNQETYCFIGYDCMDITDGTYRGDGIEIEKNVYFRPWSVEKNKRQVSD